MKKFLGIELFCALCMLFLTGCGPSGLPPVKPPVSVTWRTSLLNPSSSVMQVTNRSNRETLVIYLQVENKKLGQQASHTFKVAPGATEEIGILEMGWQFLPGEAYSLNVDGYVLSIDGTVPR